MNSEAQAVLQLLAMLLADPRSGMLIGLLVAAAWSDYGTGRIPNALVFGGAMLGVAYNTAVPAFHVSAGYAFLLALGGLLCGLLLMLPFYLMRAMGAGDVKLMGMTGAFLGYPDAIWAVLGSFLAGGALSLAYLAAKGELRRALSNLAMLGSAAGSGCVPALDARTSVGTLPYGLAIAAGTIGYLTIRQLGLIH
jgi:prepilin peptidase CpaA